MHYIYIKRKLLRDPNVPKLDRIKVVQPLPFLAEVLPLYFYMTSSEEAKNRH